MNTFHSTARHYNRIFNIGQKVVPLVPTQLQQVARQLNQRFVTVVKQDNAFYTCECGGIRETFHAADLTAYKEETT